MSRFFSLCSVLLLSSLLVACATTAGSSSVGEVMHAPDTTITTELGDVSLRNTKVEISEYFTMNNRNRPTPDGIEGQLINDTDISDGIFRIRVSVKDSLGKTKGEDTFMVFPSQRINEISNPLSELYGDVFIGKGDNIDVELLGGQYSVEYDYKLIEPKPTENNLYSNDSLSINFSISTDGVGFSLKNKINEPIKIIWNEASYVDVNGSSNKVIHTGVEYSERSSSIPPTTIPPKASTEQVVVPSNNISMIGGEWVDEPLFPHSETFGYSDESENIGNVDKYVGREFSLFLPLEVGYEKLNYNFRFRIEDVHMEK